VSDPGGSTVWVHDDGPARPGAASSGAAPSGAVPAGPAPAGPAPAGPRPPARFRRRRLAALIAAIALALAGVGAWALLGSGLFAVRSVVVTGTRLVPESEVVAAADVRPGTPLIEVNVNQVAARVLGIRQLVGVQVSTSWPNRVTIAVQERVATLAVALPGGGFDLIDGHGVVVRQAQTRPASLPLFAAASSPAAVAVATSPSALTGDPDVTAAAGVLGELPAPVRSTVTAITAAAPDQVTVQLRSGVTILWGGTDDAVAKAQELTALMATHGRYYDVSSPGTAVTSPTPAG
jgi:cell division protein FtsQ